MFIELGFSFVQQTQLLIHFMANIKSKLENAAGMHTPRSTTDS